MEVTSFAHTLVDPVRAAVYDAQLVLGMRPTFDAICEEKTYRLAMSDYALFSLLPPLMRQLSYQTPQTKYRIEAISRNTSHDIERGVIDFCLTESGWRSHGRSRLTASLREQTLFRDDFVCIVDRDHPDVGDQISLETYQKLAHAIISADGSASPVEVAWSSVGLDPRIHLVLPNFSSLIFTLPGSRLIVTVQRNVAEAIATQCQLRILECPARIEPIVEKMIWQSRRSLDPAHGSFREMIVRCAAGLRQDQSSD